jgi:hypothetical protein
MHSQNLHEYDTRPECKYKFACNYIKGESWFNFFSAEGMEHKFTGIHDLHCEKRAYENFLFGTYSFIITENSKS